MPEFYLLGKKEWEYPKLIWDAKEPARLNNQARGPLEPGNRGGPVPAGTPKKEVSLVEAIDQVELPPEIAERRAGESLLDHTLRTLPHISRALQERDIPIPEKLTEKDRRFLSEMILWSRRERAIKRLE